ncbi:MAG: hypothetical protein ACK5G8_04540 [Flavobacteriales bacterium]|jgi:hypothetical protein
MSDFREIIKAKSNADLTDIFIKNSGYQESFMEQVEEELVSRKIPIESLMKLREEQNTIDVSKLEQGEQGNQFWIATGFSFLFIGAISVILFGGWGSIITIIWPLTLGYTYTNSKTKHKDKYYHIYNESTKKYGAIMKIIAIVILGIIILRVSRIIS